MLPEGYVVSFAIFHERGFAVPAHRFLRGLLDYYEVELQHLTPNRVQHMAAFVSLCEGFLGIDPHFDLWRYFFSVSLSRRKIGGERSRRADGVCQHSPVPYPVEGLPIYASGDIQ